MRATPTAEQMYLGAPGPRGLFQGDVYRDVPFTKVGQGNNPDSDPAWSARRRHVAPILYPCDMVTSDNVTLIKAQPIVMVYDAAERGLVISADLDDVPIAVCPLPDLNGDGRMWAADFRTITVVDRSLSVLFLSVKPLGGWGVGLVGGAGAVRADAQPYLGPRSGVAPGRRHDG